MPEDGGLIGQALIGLKPVNAWVHTYTKPQTSSTRSRGLGWRIHESVEDTKLSTNKQLTLSLKIHTTIHLHPSSLSGTFARGDARAQRLYTRAAREHGLQDTEGAYGAMGSDCRSLQLTKIFRIHAAYEVPGYRRRLLQNTLHRGRIPGGHRHLSP